MGAKLRVRRDDMVEVITGNYKGVRGRILSARPREGKVVVEGVGMVWKHVKPTRQHPRGGRIEREAPIQASNVMLLCQNKECERYDRPVRIRMLLSPDRSKSRVCTKCGRAIVTEE